MTEEARPIGVFDELDTMRTVGEALDKVPDIVKVRIIRWTIERYNLPIGTVPGVSTPSKALSVIEDKGPDSIGTNFPDLPDFFSHVSPQMPWEKVLLVSYWTQQSRSDQDFPAYVISKELKNLGDSVSNITHAMNRLIERNFVIQTRKSGTSQQAQKLYKVTVKGKKYIESLIQQASQN